MSSTINVYQTLDVREKIRNYSPTPALVYSRISSLNLIIRQVEKGGTGIIVCDPSYSLPMIERYLGKHKRCLVSLDDLKTGELKEQANILIGLTTNPENLRISELNTIARRIIASGKQLKWISILHQPVFNQLFKWELRYN